MIVCGWIFHFFFHFSIHFFFSFFFGLITSIVFVVVRVRSLLCRCFQFFYSAFIIRFQFLWFCFVLFFSKQNMTKRKKKWIYFILIIISIYEKPEKKEKTMQPQFWNTNYVFTTYNTQLLDWLSVTWFCLLFF